MQSANQRTAGFLLLGAFLTLCCSKAKLESDRVIVSVGKKAPQESAVKLKKQGGPPSLSHCWDVQQIALLNKVSDHGESYLQER